MFIPPDLKQLTYDIYLRRSSDDADNQIASLPSQKEVLTKLKEQNGLGVARVVEESMSAKQPGRPIFNEEIQRLEKGIIQGLIVWDLSRASRNPVDSGTLGWLLQRGVLKGIITPQRVYLPEDNVLLLNVEFGMANQFIRDLSKNIRRGVQNKLNNGWRPGKAPEGYLNDKYGDKGERKILVDEQRFPLVRKMWDLLLTGSYTVPQILDIANNEWKYRTVPRRHSGNTPLSRTALYLIFTNPFYYGWYEFSGKWYKGQHQQMITEDEYNRAQRILGKRGKQRPKLREFSFTGMIHCGECGATITAEEKVNRYGYRYIYYHCSKKINPNCTQKCIRLEDLEKQIDDILSSIEIPEVFKDWAIKWLNKLHDTEANVQKLVHKNVDSEYEGCIQRINNLLKLKISPLNTDGSLLSDEEFATQMAELKKEKEQILTKKKEADTRVDDWVELSEKTFKFACYARHWFQNGTLQEKRQILQTLGSNLLLKNKMLYLDVPKPFLRIKEDKKEILAEIARFEPHKSIDGTVRNAIPFEENERLC